MLTLKVPPSINGDPIHGTIHGNISKSLQTFISSLLVATRLPFFHAIDPPHHWIFHPIRGFFFKSTSNRIKEYVQRSMDGGYPQIAYNIFSSVGMSFRVYVPPCKCLSAYISLQAYVPSCQFSSICMCMSLRVYGPSCACHLHVCLLCVCVPLYVYLFRLCDSCMIVLPRVCFLRVKVSLYVCPIL